MERNRFESVIWSGIYLLLLLMLYVVPLNMLVISFMWIPALILFVRLSWKSFVIHYVIVLLLVFLIIGLAGAFAITLSLFFLVPVLLMGHLYKKRAAARTVITAGIVAFLAELLLCLIGLSAAQVDINEQLTQIVNDSVALFPERFQKNISQATIDEAALLLSQLIPLYMIAMSFYYVVITHWCGRRILNRMGESIKGFKPIKEWMLPKSLVWYYLIAMVLDLFVSRESKSALAMIVWNLIPILMIAFSIQAIAFLFFVADIKKWNKLLPIAGIVCFIVSPPVHYILSLLGVFDVAFPLRKRLVKQ